MPMEAGRGAGWWLNVGPALALGVAKAKQHRDLRLALCRVMHPKVSEDGSWESKSSERGSDLPVAEMLWTEPETCLLTLRWIAFLHSHPASLREGKTSST